MSQLRGELKAKIRPLIEVGFGFKSGQGEKAVVYNRRLAEKLKFKFNFVYRVSIQLFLWLHH